MYTWIFNCYMFFDRFEICPFQKFPEQLEIDMLNFLKNAP